MSPYTIKECIYSKIEPNNIPTENGMERNDRNTENLCFQLNQTLLNGGKRSENFCAYIMTNYEPLIRVSQQVCTLKSCNKEDSSTWQKEEHNKDESGSYSSESSSLSREVYIARNEEEKINKKEEKRSMESEKVNQDIPRRRDSLPVTLEPEEYDLQTSSDKANRSFIGQENNNSNKKVVRFISAFDDLSYKELCNWLIQNGFEYIGTHLPTNISSGYELRTMSDNAWETEFGLKNDLDKKRLRMKIEEALKNNLSAASKLTKEWVSQWLEDIGLSQYKYEFLRKTINGQMLANLTYKELRILGIYNPLHQSSLKRSIQLLRQQNYHPCYLKNHANTNLRKSMILWSTTDVAAWLKNIRMSRKIRRMVNNGINGALMILEPRFNSKTLIEVLKVKSKAKRKKIKAEFEKLLPYSILQEKEDQLKSPNYVPIVQDKKAEKKYNEILATMEADELPVCPASLYIDPIYKVPPPLIYCPIHEVNINNKRSSLKINSSSYI